MPKCEVCGNDYDKAFTVTMKGKAQIFDSFECAIHALAPKCAHCGCTIIGHGLEIRTEGFFQPVLVKMIRNTNTQALFVHAELGLVFKPQTIALRPNPLAQGPLERRRDVCCDHPQRYPLPARSEHTAEFVRTRLQER